MSKDVISWECQECHKTPDALFKKYGIPTRYLCEDCFEKQENKNE